MAVGDSVNQSLHSSTSFQPASGVEIMVLKAFNGGDTDWYYGITDGTNNALHYTHYSYSNTGAIGEKFTITNTMYFYISSNTSSNKGFSGIQIK